MVIDLTDLRKPEELDSFIFLTTSLLYSFQYTATWESYELIPPQLLTSCLLALAAVYAITTVLIGHPTTSTLVFVVVAITVVEMLGMQTWLGLNIDTTALNLAVLHHCSFASHRT